MRLSIICVKNWKISNYWTNVAIPSYYLRKRDLPPPTERKLDWSSCLVGQQIVKGSDYEGGGQVGQCLPQHQMNLGQSVDTSSTVRPTNHSTVITCTFYYYDSDWLRQSHWNSISFMTMALFSFLLFWLYYNIKSKFWKQEKFLQGLLHIIPQKPTSHTQFPETRCDS